MDDPDLLPLLLLMFFSLLTHVAVSGAFTAFKQLNHTGIELSKNGGKRYRRIQSLLKKYESVLLAISIADFVITVMFTVITIIVGLWIAEFFKLNPVLVIGVVVLCLSVIEFVTREIWAARIVVSRSKSYIGLISLPLTIYFRFMKPLSNRIADFLGKLSTRLEINRNGFNFNKILAIVEDSGDSELEDDERAMIHSIIEFGDTEAHEIMVPRIDMVCVEENTDLKQLNVIIREKGHSRLPLYSEDVDHIVGIFHVKDLISREIDTLKKDTLLKDMAREAYFVPETKRLDELLKAFRQDKHHMAIVVDEYGGTAGLVTLEDVIEEIIGDIQDEYDKETPLVRKIDDCIYVVDAKIDLHELNESLEIELPTEREYESLAGFILSLTGYVPVEQETVAYENFNFLIEKVVRNRIINVRMTFNGENQKQINWGDGKK